MRSRRVLQPHWTSNPVQPYQSTQRNEQEKDSLLYYAIHILVQPMSSVEAWDNEYARLARAASQLRTQGLQSTASDAASLQQGLARLSSQVASLPLHERDRRRRLVSHLQQQSSGGSNTYEPPGASQMQQQMMQQDRMIDDLATGMGRLKHQSQNIHQEARLHVSLLSEMDNGLDSAQSGLEDETRRAARLREDQSVWKLQLTVAGLSILLVLLLLMGLSP